MQLTLKLLDHLSFISSCLARKCDSYGISGDYRGFHPIGIHRIAPARSRCICCWSFNLRPTSSEEGCSDYRPSLYRQITEPNIEKQIRLPSRKDWTSISSVGCTELGGYAELCSAEIYYAHRRFCRIQLQNRRFIMSESFSQNISARGSGVDRIWK